MGFIMDGLDAEAYDREYTDRQLLARIIGYFRPHLPVMGIMAVHDRAEFGHGRGLPVPDRTQPRPVGGRGRSERDDLAAHCLADRRHLSLRRALLELQLFPPEIHGAHGRRCGAEAAPGCLRCRAGARHVVL